MDIVMCIQLGIPMFMGEVWNIFPPQRAFVYKGQKPGQEYFKTVLKVSSFIQFVEEMSGEG